MNYDLLVVGDDREGIERAISAAQDGHSVGLIRTAVTIPSLEDMRQAANHIAEHRDVTMASWRAEVSRLVQCQADADQAELECLSVDRIFGDAKFVSRESIEVSNADERRIVSANKIVLACGTKSWHPKSLRGDDRFVFSLETLLQMNDVPQSMIVVGAGETGVSAATMMALMGAEVVVVDEHVTMTEMSGMFGALADAAQSLNIAFRLGDEVIGTELRPDLQVAVRLASGRVFVADSALICVGRVGKTDGLDLSVAGAGTDERGRVWCDLSGQTWNPGITAVGDVIGFPRIKTQSVNEPQRAIPATARKSTIDSPVSRVSLV